MKANSYNINEEAKTAIMNNYKAGLTINKLSKMFQVSKSRIIKIIHEKEAEKQTTLEDFLDD